MCSIIWTSLWFVNYFLYCVNSMQNLLLLLYSRVTLNTQTVMLVLCWFCRRTTSRLHKLFCKNSPHFDPESHKPATVWSVRRGAALYSRFHSDSKITALPEASVLFAFGECLRPLCPSDPSVSLLKTLLRKAPAPLLPTLHKAHAPAVEFGRRGCAEGWTGELPANL